MFKVLLSQFFFTWAGVVACGSSDKTNDGGVQPKIESPSSKTKEEGSSGGSQDGKRSEASGKKDKFIGVIKLKDYHVIFKGKSGIAAGICIGYEKKEDDDPALTDGPCPSTLEVGKDKAESPMFVACPVSTGGGGGGNTRLQVFLYENLVDLSDRKENSASIERILSVSKKDSAETICDKFKKMDAL